MARVKLERVVTPAGVAHYPHIQTPDDYKGKQKYKCGLVVEADNGFVALITKKTDEAFAAAQAAVQEAIDGGELKGKALAKAKEELEVMEVHYPFEPEYSDDGEETGNIILKTSANANFMDKKTKKLKDIKLTIFDAKNQKVDPCPNIWGGSILKLAVDINPYHMTATHLAGVSLRLAQVQIIELESGSGGKSEFGEEEGSYVAAAQDSSDFDDEAEDDDDESGDF